MALATPSCALPWAAVGQATLAPVVIVAPRPTVVAPASVDPANLHGLGAATRDTASLPRGIPGVSLQGAGGTHVGQGATMSMNGVPWGIPVLGPGRSVHASVTLSF